MEMSWADDFHMANSMVQKTIGFMKQEHAMHTLIKMIKDDEDRNFAKKLLFKASTIGILQRKK
jgi:N utilization substance protein B